MTSGHLSPQEFEDKNGKKIKPGAFLLRRFIARWRERPGHKRVAISSISGMDVIVPDEGGLGEPEKHWVAYKVEWDGACLIARRYKYSDFQALMGAEHFDELGNPIEHQGSVFYFFNRAFNSKVYEVYDGNNIGRIR